ncbi:MAG: HAD family phosphatase, partial [Actinobacteria bacterium]|nr:HAD family phosphatase [Actinomycetota bacterium]
YLRGAEALGVPIEGCFAIEDSRTGLRSAAASGAVAIGVPNLVDLSEAPSHALWSTLAGLDISELRARFAELRATELRGSLDLRA